MSSAGKQELAASEPQRAMQIVPTTLSIVATVFLGGGFYYGMTKQKKALIEEEKSLNKVPSSQQELLPPTATAVDRKVVMGKSLPPAIAASKALLGVTVVSVAGCCLLAGGIAICLGMTNWTELRQRLQKTSRCQKEHVDFEELVNVKKEKRDVIKVKKEQTNVANE